MKSLKKHFRVLAATVIAITVCLLLISNANAATEGEEISLFQWGYWEQMVAPAAGPGIPALVANVQPEFRPQPPPQPPPGPGPPPPLIPNPPDPIRPM